LTIPTVKAKLALGRIDKRDLVAKLDSPCMFCGDLPCTCDGATSKKKIKPRKKAAQPPKPVETKDAITFDDVSVPSETSRFKPGKPQPVADRDLSFESALEALDPILSSSSQKTVDRMLHRERPTELDKRLVDWRNRNVR